MHNYQYWPTYGQFGPSKSTHTSLKSLKFIPIKAQLPLKWPLFALKWSPIWELLSAHFPQNAISVYHFYIVPVNTEDSQIILIFERSCWILTEWLPLFHPFEQVSFCANSSSSSLLLLQYCGGGSSINLSGILDKS